MATDLVRTSRDGDQFHYFWAARRSLQLLDPGGDLVRLVVEGSEEGSPDDASEQVIDLAEYYKATASLTVSYLQMKHSTEHADDPWTASFVRKTVLGFAKRFADLLSAHSALADSCEFVIVTNRPMAETVAGALQELRAGQTISQSAKYLHGVARERLSESEIASFFQRLRVDADAPDLFRLEQVFRADVAGLLPGPVGNEDVLLKEMISRRATSLETADPSVTRNTVLAQLGTSGDMLFPAPSDFEPPGAVIETSQIAEAVDLVRRAHGRPVLVHAAGGVGKSVLAQRLHDQMPKGSLTLLYDCFARGSYRRSSTLRHQHRQAYVQLANELATFGLARPLVPSATATDDDYSRAFVARVVMAARALESIDPGRLLTVIIDAADNAVMISRERSERSFVTDLIREDLPSNVRLVLLCRTERRELLEPPSTCVELELRAFDLQETRAHLALAWHDVTCLDAEEFHRRTGGNPRVQALVIDKAQDMADALSDLGEVAIADRLAFEGLLRHRVDKIRDGHVSVSHEINRLCRALAALRPRIPIRVLAALAGCDPAFIHSFSSDLGRPLLIDGDAVQFRDEPSESWFRSNYRSTAADLDELLESLTPLADVDPYAATALPQLLFEAGRTSALIELALSDSGLPTGSDVERLEVAHQRAQFALKAALKSGLYVEAARLAVRAGHLAAGQTRRLKLIAANPDLAGLLLDAQVIEDLVATRALAGAWPGSHLAHDGALLSAAPGQHDVARSKLRSASEWMGAYIHHALEVGDSHDVEDSDVTALAWGLLNTDGPDACAGFLASWRPAQVAFRCGTPIAHRLVDAGRQPELEGLARSTQGSKYVQLAAADAAYRGSVLLDLSASRHLVRMLTRLRRAIPMPNRYPSEPHALLGAVTWILILGRKHGLLDKQEALRILNLYLPDSLGRSAGSSHNRGTGLLLRAFALRAHLQDVPLLAEDLATSELREALGKPHMTDRDASDYKANVIPMARLAALWVERMFNVGADEGAFDVFTEALRGIGGYPTPDLLLNFAPLVAAGIAVHQTDSALLPWLSAWTGGDAEKVWRSTRLELVRTLSGSLPTQATAIAIANQIRTELAATKEDADSKCSDLLLLGRATLRFSSEEARSHFDLALEIADRVGDDVYTQWKTALDAARRLSAAPPDAPRCYRLSQVAEGLEPYLGDAFDAAQAMSALLGIHEVQAYAIASRWRDRRVAGLATTCRSILAHERLKRESPKVALALGALNNDVPLADLLLEATERAPLSASILRLMGGELRDRPLSRSNFDRLDAAAGPLGLDIQSLGFGVRSEEATEEVSRPHVASTTEPVALFEPDLLSAEGWTTAIVKTHERHFTFGLNDLMDAVREAPLHNLPVVTTALAACPTADLHLVNQYLGIIASLEVRPASLTHLCHDLALQAVKRQPGHLVLRSYETLDLEQLSALTGRNEGVYRNAAWLAVATGGEAIGSEACFHLAESLFRELSPAGVAVVLDDLLAMHEDVAPRESTDGAFNESSLDERTPSEAIAGLLWCALGDSLASTRWEAAHAVRLLAELGCSSELEAISGFALGTLDASPFFDQRLTFYERHAWQWLIMALHRAMSGNALLDTLSTTLPAIRHALFNLGPHALIRPLAAELLLRLHALNPCLSDSELGSIDGVGSPIDVQRRKKEWQRPRSMAEESPATRFRFFFDFENYWCRPLASVFDLDAEDVLQRADAMINQTWGDAFSGERDEDLRRTYQLYDANKAYVRDASWPQEDDLDFYLSIHALYAVADELLASLPVVEDSDDSDTYEDWHRGVALTRSDGRWLSDLRDAPPARPALKLTSDSRLAPSDTHWVFDTRAVDFEVAVFQNDGAVTVWAQETDQSYYGYSTASVRSALVLPTLAPSLVVAMQTAASARQFAFPEPESSWLGNCPERFVMDAWIAAEGWRVGIDDQDPRARGMRWPTPALTTEFIARLGLEPDEDHRTWRSGGEGVMLSRSWDETSEHQERGRSGRRLTMTSGFLIDCLRTLDRSLIIQVMLTRHLSDRYTSRKESDERLPYLDPYFRIYLLDQEGARWQL